MAETFTTYSVNGMGGPIYCGIPSRDVALIMAIDFERYDWDEDEDDAELTRYAVEVTEDDDGSGPVTVICGQSLRGVGIVEERRCITCRVVPQQRYW